MARSMTGVMHHMEIQRGMKSAKFNDIMGATSGCTF
jgi:hypothetical protein